MFIHAELLLEYELSITTRGMSRNASQAVTILPFYTPNNFTLTAKQLVRNITEGKSPPLRELCKTIAIKEGVKMKLTKAENGIKVGAANKRQIFDKTDMRVDNFNKIYFYYVVFCWGDDVNHRQTLASFKRRLQRAKGSYFREVWVLTVATTLSC